MHQPISLRSLKRPVDFKRPGKRHYNECAYRYLASEEWFSFSQPFNAFCSGMISPGGLKYIITIRMPKGKSYNIIILSDCSSCNCELSAHGVACPALRDNNQSACDDIVY